MICVRKATIDLLILLEFPCFCEKKFFFINFWQCEYLYFIRVANEMLDNL